MKSILITGVSGFVGTNLISYFNQREDIRVIGFSRREVSGISMMKEYSSGSLNEFNIDSVVHLAGIAHDLSGQFKPEDYYKVNLDGTKKAVFEFLKSNVSQFIFVSSIKAVCDTSSTLADETISPNPKTDYGKSKRMAEEYILKVAEEKTDKSFYILRPTMIHGPGNKGNLNLLYRFAKLGLPFPFGAFHNQRSFLGIDNFDFVIEAIISGKVRPGVYHLADDGFLSTVELYSLICETMDSKPRTWNVSKSMINLAATVVGKKDMIAKLTENMMVSNKKIVEEIRSPFPVSLRDGLTKTIKSFDGI